VVEVVVCAWAAGASSSTDATQATSATLFIPTRSTKFTFSPLVYTRQNTGYATCAASVRSGSDTPARQIEGALILTRNLTRSPIGQFERVWLAISL
jgi:hypothetical protein